jgi:hypothetical protein
MSKKESTFVPTPDSAGTQLAVKLSEMSNANNDHLVGVLCTLVEASFSYAEQSKAIKDLVRRELYNSARDRVLLIHSIVGRAEVESFRKHSTLEEQTKQPAPDSYMLSEE